MEYHFSHPIVSLLMEWYDESSFDGIFDEKKISYSK